ncbi:MAG: CARDB domain-containing protein [archaeon]
MGGKLFMTILMLFALLFSFVAVYQNLPRSPVEMQASEIEPEVVAIINYGATPVFVENLRFNHNAISYFIEDECAKVRRDAMIEAFDIFADEMKLISFYEIKNKDVADIEVGCSDDYIELGENLFTAGEGGPSKIINTSGFRTIEKGKILLYSDSQCDYPGVELHELLHVFGFDHTEDPNNIMYNVSRCNQGITADMVELIDKLYSIEALPDAVISELVAVKKGRYVDFNITVLNEGLIGIASINLTIVANDKEIQMIDLGEIDIGYGRTLRAENIRLPSRSVEKIDFIIDRDNVVRELNENNNFMEMVVESQ